jgi:hypothetical protein
MADQSGLKSGLGPEGVVSPPIQAASRFSLTGTSAEALLTFGSNRTVVDPASGNVSEKLATEWFLTLSVSPIVAKQIHQFLTQWMVGY